MTNTAAANSPKTIDPAKIRKTDHHVWNHRTVAEIEARDLLGQWPAESSHPNTMPGGYVRLASGLDGIELHVFSGPDNRATKVILDQVGIDELIKALQDVREDVKPIER